ncbi:Lambda NinG family protein [Delftia acidovorans SPH-1]|uniref:Lambda NinG family protein n=1 Tax=Delftia acidovorans (strain DSM 14801 / SPH-1) TaxID=398578 RepID=A9BYN6_DELAS|nr:recombination protein NinG [Delftia acidovorans]ABX34579.1 Lambda NinG family protein [Delftia acidovorans SPH-1]QPS76052.1 recombination protein NinG [Delftia acidovorans]
MTFRRTRCAHCRAKLDPGQRIHPHCIAGYAEAEGAKAERKRQKQARAAARVEKAETRRRKEATKPRAKWLSECQDIINKIVRLRDKHLGCCSCDRGPEWDGQWHASHLRSVGAASAVRFNLWNIHKGCSICNNHLSGNLAEYLPRIRARIGDEKVDWLYTQNQLVKHDVEYLKKFKRVMGKRLRRIEKRCN